MDQPSGSNSESSSWGLLTIAGLRPGCGLGSGAAFGECGLNRGDSGVSSGERGLGEGILGESGFNPPQMTKQELAVGAVKNTIVIIQPSKLIIKKDEISHQRWHGQAESLLYYKDMTLDFVKRQMDRFKRS